MHSSPAISPPPPSSIPAPQSPSAATPRTAWEHALAHCPRSPPACALLDAVPPPSARRLQTLGNLRSICALVAGRRPSPPPTSTPRTDCKPRVDDSAARAALACLVWSAAELALAHELGSRSSHQHKPPMFPAQAEG